jgi:hypothetical protein
MLSSYNNHLAAVMNITNTCSNQHMQLQLILQHLRHLTSIVKELQHMLLSDKSGYTHAIATLFFIWDLRFSQLETQRDVTSGSLADKYWFRSKHFCYPEDGYSMFLHSTDACLLYMMLTVFQSWPRQIGERCKIWDFHGGDYEEWCLLGCYTMWLL